MRRSFLKPRGKYKHGRVDWQAGEGLLLCGHISAVMCDQHRFFFEFDKAFAHRLIEKFEASPAHPLTEDVARLEKGVYVLYRRRRLVYAGEVSIRR